MKNSRILVGLVLLSFTKCGNSFAQKPDSLGNWKLHIDLRAAIIKRKNIQMWGGTVGRTFGSLGHEVTLGYYWLGANGRERLAGVERRASIREGKDTYSSPDWYFGSLGYWHNFVNSRDWKLSMPVEVGLGKFKDRERILPEGSHSVIQSKVIVPAQVGGCIEWKATRWVGLGLQVGYRYDLGAFRVREMNAFYYRTRVILYPTVLYDGCAYLFGRKLK